MTHYTHKQTHAMASNTIETLAVLCAASSEKIIDLLTGYLWSEEEAGNIKASDGKYDMMELFNSTTEALEGKDIKR